MSLFGKGRSANKKPAPPPPPAPPPAALQPPVRQPIGFETVFGIETEIEGRLKCDANIRIDGAFTGTLEITGNVLVGETGNIKADINARNISIAGTVRGNITGNKVQLLRTARVWGDIQAVALTTEEGAFIDGKITMNNSPDEQTDTTNEDMPSTSKAGETTLTFDPDHDKKKDEVTTLVFDSEEEQTTDDTTTITFDSDEENAFDDSATITFRSEVDDNKSAESDGEEEDVNNDD